MAKRILTAIRLDKIAAVDAPCQAHATVAIVKRKPVDAPRALAKATFQEALAGQLLADRVRDIFYDAFDSQYECNTAFRQSLVDELANGGDGSTATAAYVAAMQAMAQAAATAARAVGANATDAQLIAAVNDAVTKFTTQQELPMLYNTKADLQAAIAKMNKDGAVPAEITKIKKSAVVLDATDLLPAELKDGPNEEVATLTKRLDRMTKSQALAAGPVTSHYAGLTTDDERDAFLAKSATDQLSEAIAKASGDAVVYTTAAGVQIKKSDGPMVLIMAQGNDALLKRLDAIEANGAGDAIAKRLQAYPNIAKKVAEPLVKMALSLEGDEQTAAFASLATMNKNLGGVFKMVGTSETGDAAFVEAGGEEGEGAEVQKKMDVIVKRIMTDEKLDIGKATVKAAADPEYAALYKAQVEGVPLVNAAAGSIASTAV